MHIYEYLFTAVIIIGILLASSIMVTTLSSPSQNTSDQDQLKTTAQKIMTQILLDPGYPYNWGSDNTNPTNLAIFGLAKYGETSRETYVLDPDKVLRLNNKLQATDSYFVDPSIASKLLNLGIPSNYGFTLEFNETLQISPPARIGSPDRYSITIKSDYSLPIINANVTATLYYVNGTTIVHEGPLYTTSSYDGTCNIDFGVSNTGQAKTLVVIVDYYGERVARIYPVGTKTVTATLLGNRLIPDLEQPYNTNGADGSEVILIEDHSVASYTTREFPIANAGTTTKFLLSQRPEPSAIAVLAILQDGSLLVGSRDFAISYRSIPAIQSATFAYSLERIVLIGDSTFAVTLYLWRMSS